MSAFGLKVSMLFSGLLAGLITLPSAVRADRPLPPILALATEDSDSAQMGWMVNEHKIWSARTAGRDATAVVACHIHTEPAALHIQQPRH